MKLQFKKFNPHNDMFTPSNERGSMIRLEMKANPLCSVAPFYRHVLLVKTENLHTTKLEFRFPHIFKREKGSRRFKHDDELHRAPSRGLSQNKDRSRVVMTVFGCCYLSVSSPNVDSVNAKLEKKTVATCNGSLRYFKPKPQVYLRAIVKRYECQALATGIVDVASSIAVIGSCPKLC
ncbi:hypothetical protein M8C21_006195, partial [Ambrosia artemisiifolia]